MSNKKQETSYLDSAHRLGRIGSVGALIFMMGIPLFMSAISGFWPNIGNVLKVSAGLLALFVPIAISEVISYTPVLGSASYISFITGNLVNLKLPCAINAMELAEVDQGTEEGDVISTISIAVSSITTMIIIAAGVILLVPLTPLFENPNVQIATSYMLPALFGGMLVPMLLNNKVGEYTVKNRLLPIIPPMIVILLVNIFVRPLQGFEGILMIIVIPISVFSARYLYNKGKIKLIPIDDSESDNTDSNK